MELAEFITETLGQIMKGVSDAIKEHGAGSLGGVINPRPASKASDPMGLPMSPVDFDVAVTVESSNAGSKGAGINIKVIEAKLSKDKAEKTTGESRIRFAVPVTLPVTSITDL
ncbi:MAG: hypothetical protein V4459_14460 [Pseudomonadota bacterium]